MYDSRPIDKYIILAVIFMIACITTASAQSDYSEAYERAHDTIYSDAPDYIDYGTDHEYSDEVHEVLIEDFTFRFTIADIDDLLNNSKYTHAVRATDKDGRSYYVLQGCKPGNDGLEIVVFN